MVPHGSSRTVEDLTATRNEALRGGVVGAAKYGIITAVLGFTATLFSPIYRSLTIQFKVFIQMSGMMLGGWLEADRRARAWEGMRVREMRRERALKRDEGVWNEWERLVEGKGKERDGGDEGEAK
ncbi:MAG: hypothetical protein Q9182_007320 [Xanthomendoza sp. 2 TL-2023]